VQVTRRIHLPRHSVDFTSRSATFSGVLLGALLTLLISGVVRADVSFADVADSVQPKVVKIYGAGGLRGLEAYQSGILISAEGHVLTVASHVLDSDTVTVILSDGRKLEATLVGTDRRLELAVLELEADDLSYFNLQNAVEADVAARVLAFSNLFGVATGDEPLSVMQGWVAAKTVLNARRGTFKTPYRGPVYIVDVITDNPGAAGGALTNHHGQLLGILGKELRDARTNTWLNYALPIAQVIPAVNYILSGKLRAASEGNRERPSRSLTLSALGIMLVPNVLSRTPAYIDAVHADSTAHAAGLRPDDLVVMLDGRAVESCRSLRSELSYIESDAEITITVLRAGDLILVPLRGGRLNVTTDETSP